MDMACSERHYKKLNRGKYAQHGKSADWPELETDVLKWVEAHCQNGIAIATKIIHIHTLKLAHGRTIEDLIGGATWYYCFVKHNGLCVRAKTELAQEVPVECKKRFCDSDFTGF
jgi:hypothetical protein